MIISTNLKLKEAYMGNWLHITIVVDTEKKTVSAFGTGVEIFETGDVHILNASEESNGEGVEGE